MLGLGHQYRYYLYVPATDMRKSFDGLSGLVRNEMNRNPMDGDIYIFLNQRRNFVKLLLLRLFLQDSKILYVPFFGVLLLMKCNSGHNLTSIRTKCFEGCEAITLFRFFKTIKA